MRRATRSLWLTLGSLLLTSVDVFFPTPFTVRLFAKMAVSNNARMTLETIVLRLAGSFFSRARREFHVLRASKIVRHTHPQWVRLYVFESRLAVANSPRVCRVRNITRHTEYILLCCVSLGSEIASCANNARARIILDVTCKLKNNHNQRTKLVIARHLQLARRRIKD